MLSEPALSYTVVVDVVPYGASDLGGDPSDDEQPSLLSASPSDDDYPEDPKTGVTKRRRSREKAGTTRGSAPRRIRVLPPQTLW